MTGYLEDIWAHGAEGLRSRDVRSVLYSAHQHFITWSCTTPHSPGSYCSFSAPAIKGQEQVGRSEVLGHFLVSKILARYEFNDLTWVKSQVRLVQGMVMIVSKYHQVRSLVLNILDFYLTGKIIIDHLEMNGHIIFKSSE